MFSLLMAMIWWIWWKRKYMGKGFSSCLVSIILSCIDSVSGIVRRLTVLCLQVRSYFSNSRGWCVFVTRKFNLIKKTDATTISRNIKVFTCFAGRFNFNTASNNKHWFPNLPSKYITMNNKSTNINFYCLYDEEKIHGGMLSNFF